MRVLTVGWTAALVEVDATDDVAPLYRRLLALRDDGALPAGTELVPAARTVLVDTGSPPPDLATLLERADRCAEPSESAPARDGIVIAVSYDGPDLADVAAHAGITPAEVIRLHTTAELTVAFCGFAPGFGYLTGVPAQLRVPRRASPRTAVEPGSVGLAGEFTGVYPRRSPGGWQLIGRTDAVLWDADRDPPALLAPGTRVRFAAV